MRTEQRLDLLSVGVWRGKSANDEEDTSLQLLT